MNKDRLYLTITLIVFFLLDICVIIGILLHGKANFSELIKHFK